MYARVVPALARRTADGARDRRGIRCRTSRDGDHARRTARCALAPVIVTVVFGALLVARHARDWESRKRSCAYAAEFGGDRPAAARTRYSRAAVALLFYVAHRLWARSSWSGRSCLPIMLTIGVPRKTAATLFMLAYRARLHLQHRAVDVLYERPSASSARTLQPVRLRARRASTWCALCRLCVRALPRDPRVRRTGHSRPRTSRSRDGARRSMRFRHARAADRPVLRAFMLDRDRRVRALRPSTERSRPRCRSKAISKRSSPRRSAAPRTWRLRSWLFMGIGMLSVATSLPAVHAALRPLVAAVARTVVAWLRRALRRALAARAVSRPAQSLRRRHRRCTPCSPGSACCRRSTLVAAVMAVVQVQNVCDPTNTAERLGRRISRALPVERDHAAHPAVSSRRRDRGDARRRCCSAAPLLGDAAVRMLGSPAERGGAASREHNGSRKPQTQRRRERLWLASSRTPHRPT
jgi:hypothetical protein